MNDHTTGDWKASPIDNYNVDGELFRAIITADDGKRLVAQCTSVAVAEYIVSIHSGYKRLLAAIHATPVCPSTRTEFGDDDGEIRTQAELELRHALGIVFPKSRKCEICGLSAHAGRCQAPTWR